MAFVLNDRVLEASTTTGTGNITLSGAPSGYQTFNAGIGANNTTFYAVFNTVANEWELGLGTLSNATNLQRTTVYSSSSANAAVNFSAGTKNVFVTMPASKSVANNIINTFTDAQVVQAASAATEVVRVRGTDTNTSALASQRYSADANPAEINFYKSRGTTVGSDVRLTSSNYIGRVNFYGCGSNTGSYPVVARISARNGSTTADNDLPGIIEFDTRGDGSSGTLATRMTLSASGATIDGDITSSTGAIIAAGYVNASYAQLIPPTASFINVAQVTQWAAPTTGYSAGDVIYTQDAYYAATNLASPGYIPTYQSVYLANDFTLQAASGVQACLTAANDTLTIAAATTYEFEGQYIMNTGATTHTTAMAFSLGSNATVSSFEYTTILWSAAANTIATAASFTHVSGVASKVLNATSTAVYTMIKFKGVMRTTLGGTITPQIAFSANPTGTNLMKKGSFIKFTPLGSDTVEPIGLWA